MSIKRLSCLAFMFYIGLTASAIFAQNAMPEKNSAAKELYALFDAE